MYVNMEFDVLVHTDGIHVPRSAVLQTGERSLVFVRAADGSLVPREVRTGVATSEHIEVLSGLAEGEVVVTSANFLIDAESNLGTSLEAMPGAAAEAPAPGPADPHAGHAAPRN
jgi:Cu(I)/Ag(I) efflux system membrane fusion protein